MPKKEPKMIPCKKCGQTIASTAKTCPHCGAKNMPPLYRRPWFIAIIVILVIGAIGGAFGSQTPQKGTPSKQVNSTVNTADSSANSEVSKGDIIVVKGKIKNIGEVMGYSLDIDEVYQQ